VTASEGGIDNLLEEHKSKNSAYNDDIFKANQNSLIIDWKDEAVRDKVSTWK
jgi:hypothetical protein